MAVAPWVLALALVVSVTAEAGQDPSQGVSTASQAPASEFASPMRQALLLPPLRSPGDLFARASAESLEIDNTRSACRGNRMADGHPELEGIGAGAAYVAHD